MNTISNPSVPFNLHIPGGMCIGKMVTVQGTVPTMSQRFAVNLINSSGDIALHVCPKFRENVVVRNTVSNLNWGKEENHGLMPIYPGQNFEIIILCEAYDFKIAFNQRHFTEFNHRLPLNSISNIAVDGDVIVFNVHFKEPSYRYNNVPSNTSYGFQTGLPSTPNYNSNNLYPSGLYSGQSNASSYYNSVPNSGVSSLYPQQPNYGNQIPHQSPFPQVPSQNPTSQTSHTKSGILDQAGKALAGMLGPGLLAGGHYKHNKGGGVLGRTLGTAVAGAALTGHLNPIKAAKKPKKVSKALKYGFPLAGAGLGAYALHKGLKKGFRRSSSSSSSSSCSS